MTHKTSAFKAMTYNPERISSLATVIAPPYDVIDDKLLNALYELSPYNFVRIDLTKYEGELRYETAKNTFEAWAAETVLIKDSQNAYYAHAHTFHLPNGKTVTRTGFFAAVRIDDSETGAIKPHEKTLDAPKEDRLKLSRALNAQLSPIFMLYPDRENSVQLLIQKTLQSTPHFDFVTPTNERHQLWKIKDAHIIRNITTKIDPLNLFIADGHHRYETSKNHLREILSANPELAENAAPRFVLSYLVNLYDSGLIILPIHRSLHGLANFNWDDLIAKLSQKYSVSSWDHTQTLDQKPGVHSFILRSKTGAIRLDVDHQKWLASQSAQSLAPELQNLDVSVLHKLIFEEELELSESSQARQENLLYWKTAEDLETELASERCQCTIELNATGIEQMTEVASAGLKMPQKSTFFYPKVPSGLVIHDVHPHEIDGE